MTQDGMKAIEKPAGNGLRAGSLSALAIAFFVVSAAGPLVAMAGGIPLAMLFGNGPGIPALFLAATIILCLFSAGYTAMAHHIRNAGAFYAFAAAGLGRRAAGATGMLALLSYNAIQIGLYGLFGVAVDALLTPLIGFSLPWWAYAFAAMGSIAFLGYRQVDLSAKILGVLVASEYLVVLLLDAGIVAQGGDSGLSMRPFLPEIVSGGAPYLGLMLCFSAFIGFEATTIYSEEARNSERTVPLATYFSVLLIGGFYMLSTWAVVMGTGVDNVFPTLKSLSDPTSFLFSVSDRYVGPGVSEAMRVLFVTSIYASLLAFHNAIARYFFALGRDGLLPTSLGDTHPRFQSPHRGSLLQSLLALLCIAVFAIMGADPVLVVFTLPSAVATLGIILLMVIASAATWRFFAKREEGGLRRTVLPLLSFFLLGGIALFASLRFDVMAGASSLGVQLLPSVLLLAALVGVAIGRDASQTADHVPPR